MFKVRAKNSCGTTDFSNTILVNTGVPYVVNVPNQVKNVALLQYHNTCSIKV
jgi:hypothetical protein